MHPKAQQQWPNQPSIFDVLAEESFAGTLKPAIKYLFTFLSAQYPGKFSKPIQWFDEIYLLFDAGLQNYYLKHYGASFSENFYGFKRIFQSSGSVPCRGFAKIQSLLFLVAFPYLRVKLRKLYDRLSLLLESYPKQRQVEPLGVWLARLLLPVFSGLKLIFSIWSFILQFTYITSKSSVHSPLLLLSNVRLENLSSADMAVLKGTSSPPSRKLFWHIVYGIPFVISRMFGYFLFFVQFLDVFYNSDLGTQLRSTVGNVSQRIPPAPHTALKETSVHSLETHICPLCLQQRVDDTVLSVSGYVFCHSCIKQYVLREKKCPVTSLPANICHLIKLFPFST